MYRVFACDVFKGTYKHLHALLICRDPAEISSRCQLGWTGCPLYLFFLARLAAGQNFFFDFERISFHVMNAYSGMYALSMVIYWSECECQRELYVRGMGYQVAVRRKQGVFRWRKFSGIVRTYPRVMRGNMEFVNRILLHRHDFYCYI